ncbi:hypothetical protein EWM64_g1051 [Hericium alpestre]|uniref:Uncharacterized protein n=1 Tax=Hericium alpestre TaxID=135208 RepID=A0A4Z0A9F3_9AGAM|nr:hypothetical protein EWM64_g1051 [Hericium alpestre]
MTDTLQHDAWPKKPLVPSTKSWLTFKGTAYTNARMASKSASDSMLLLSVPSVDHSILFMSARYAMTSDTECRRALAIEHLCVITLYIPSAWESALKHAGLSSKYPTLVHNLIYGAPIGNPPLLASTFIPPNMPNALEHPEFIEEHIAEELATGHLSGPFSLSEAFLFFGGHFCTAPLGVVEKEPGSGKWHMIRNLSAEDTYGNSTNGWLDAKDIVIMWHTVTYFADLVGIFLLYR